jgi:hypothetical protein
MFALHAGQGCHKHDAPPALWVCLCPANLTTHGTAQSWCIADRQLLLAFELCEGPQHQAHLLHVPLALLSSM